MGRDSGGDTMEPTMDVIDIGNGFFVKHGSLTGYRLYYYEKPLTGWIAPCNTMEAIRQTKNAVFNDDIYMINNMLRKNEKAQSN